MSIGEIDPDLFDHSATPIEGRLIRDELPGEIPAELRSIPHGGDAHRPFTSQAVGLWTNARWVGGLKTMREFQRQRMLASVLLCGLALSACEATPVTQATRSIDTLPAEKTICMSSFWTAVMQQAPAARAAAIAPAVAEFDQANDGCVLNQRVVSPLLKGLSFAPPARSPQQSMALIDAALNGGVPAYIAKEDWSAYEWLIDQSADAYDQSLQVFSHLISRGVNPLERKGAWESLVHYAAANDRQGRFVQKILDSGGSASAVSVVAEGSETRSYGTPLHVAADFNNPGAASVLMENGARNVPARYGTTSGGAWDPSVTPADVALDNGDTNMAEMVSGGHISLGGPSDPAGATASDGQSQRRQTIAGQGSMTSGSCSDAAIEARANQIIAVADQRRQAATGVAMLQDVVIWLDTQLITLYEAAQQQCGRDFSQMIAHLQNDRSQAQYNLTLMRNETAPSPVAPTVSLGDLLGVVAGGLSLYNALENKGTGGSGHSDATCVPPGC